MPLSLAYLIGLIIPELLPLNHLVADASTVIHIHPMCKNKNKKLPNYQMWGCTDMNIPRIIIHLFQCWTSIIFQITFCEYQNKVFFLFFSNVSISTRLMYNHDCNLDIILFNKPVNRLFLSPIDENYC